MTRRSRSFWVVADCDGPPDESLVQKTLKPRTILALKLRFCVPDRWSVGRSEDEANSIFFPFSTI